MKVIDVTPPPVPTEKLFQLTCNEEELQIIYSLLAASYQSLFSLPNYSSRMYQEVRDALGKVDEKYPLTISKG